MVKKTPLTIVFLSLYSGLVDRGVETFVDAIASRLASDHKITVVQGGVKTSKPYDVISISTDLDTTNLSPKTHILASPSPS